jgi:hypothetical protein
MDEFIAMITEGQVVDENFGSREIAVLYNTSIYTQVDEIDEDRHMRMYFDEFLDGIGRVADRIAVNSPYDEVKLDKVQLAALPLHIKLKKLIEILLKNTLRRDFVEFAEKKILGTSKPEKKADPELAFKVRRDPIPDKTQYSTFGDTAQ